jgi:23S rRNA (uridine2552-2'-O)-methyltransferase
MNNGAMKNKREKPDHYTIQAVKEGYPARSVYKLKEIQEKFGIIPKSGNAIDFGASPGSWSLYLLEQMSAQSTLIALDLKEAGDLEKRKSYKKTKARLEWIVGDAFSQEIQEKIKTQGPYSLVVSDAAPNTTGNRSLDATRSSALVEEIVNLSFQTLSPGGNFCSKIFQGADEQALIKLLKAHFSMVKVFKPKACRKDSFETYIVAKNFK